MSQMNQTLNNTETQRLSFTGEQIVSCLTGFESQLVPNNEIECFTEMKQIAKIILFKHCNVTDDDESKRSAIFAIVVEKLLFQWIDLMMTQLDAELWQFMDCDRHAKFCMDLRTVLGKCNKIDRQTCDLLFDYLVKVISKFTCYNRRAVSCAFEALKEMPFALHQTLLLKLIDSINRLDTKYDPNEQWANHGQMCQILLVVVKKNKDTLHEHTFRRIFDYIMKLLETCIHTITVCSAHAILRQLPVQRIEASLARDCRSLVEDASQSSRPNWTAHQAWCTLVDRLLQLCYRNYRIENHLEKLFSQNFMKLLFDYFTILLSYCIDHMPTLLSAVLSMEKLCVKRLWDDEQVASLKAKLLDHLYYSNGSVLPDKVDFARYQVDWCVRWCVDNVMTGQLKANFPPVKLSPDRLGVRNDNVLSDAPTEKCPHPVRSLFGVADGAFYYEVTLVTEGEMLFGWATRNMTSTLWESPIDTNQYFIGFDVTQKKLQNGDFMFECSSMTNCLNGQCQQGDVIGCLIDFVNAKFVFYHNGKQAADSPIKIGGPYYACAKLVNKQQFNFNFGQTPFVFAPKNVYCSNFHEASGGNMDRYRLAETVRTREYTSYHNFLWKYWFKHPLIVENQVDLLFTDQIQTEFNETIKVVQNDIHYDREIVQKKYFIMNFENPKMKTFKITRYIQSFIEVMNKVDDHKVDVAAQWIGKVIEDEIEIAIHAHLLELLYPYIHQRIEFVPQGQQHRHRNICIVLSHLIKYSELNYSFLEEIRSQVFTYLTRTLISTGDKWTQLFVMIALDNLHLRENEKRQLADSRIIQLLNNCAYATAHNEERIYQRLVSFYNSPLSYQLNFASKQLRTHVLNTFPIARPNPVPTALNINDRTQHLKLSHDHYSVRSDWRWQSGRCECPINKGIVYFEAFLLTSGPARIGWSTVRSELERTQKIGEDSFSIAFDGYSQCVWHNKTAIKLENSGLPKWKAGGVVGCLIKVVKNSDGNEKRFTFYLNGQLVNYSSESSQIYSSPHPYYASVSLASHQQVWFNFGQFDFKYSPEEDYLSLYHYSLEYPSHKSSSFNMNNNNIKNSILTIDSNNIIGNVSMRNQELIISPTIDSNLKKGLTFECITCPACHREILLQRFLLECCPCLKLSIKRSTNELLAITDPISSSAQNHTSELSAGPHLPLLLPQLEKLSREEKKQCIAKLTDLL